MNFLNILFNAKLLINVEQFNIYKKTKFIKKLNFILKKLREAFEKESYEKDRPRFLLSAAVGAAKERIEQGYEVDKICQ